MRLPLHPPARRRAAWLVTAVALALGAAGCSGDGGEASSPAKGATAQTAPSHAEREAIREAVLRFFGSNDVRVVCERTLTPRLFRLIFTGPAACRKVAAETEDDRPPKRIEISGITSGGGRATAHASIIGGESAGARGIVSLRKRTEGWRTDDLSSAFLRSLVKAGVRTDQGLPRRVGRCIDRRFRQLPDERFKRLAYALIGHRPPATVWLLRGLSECERRRRGVSSVRRRVERSVASSLRQAGAKPKTIACALERLKRTLPDNVIIDLVAYETRRLQQRVTREVVAATIACGAAGPVDPGSLSPT